MKARRDVNEKKPMDEATKEMDPESREKALRIAHKYQIGEEDPAWILVRLAVESISDIEKVTIEATKALREASVKVTEATRDEVKAAREKAAAEIAKMTEAAKGNIAAALGTVLESKIEEAVNQLKSQSNRPLHKKWLIALGVGILISAGLGAWGTYSIHKKWVAEGWDKGVEDGISMANPTVKSFHDLIDCALPGGKVQWSNDGKKAYCIAYPDPKTGQPAKWRIR